MARRQKPHKTGAAASFMTRAQAIKRLQITLKDFRRLCIIKGIHPHMPRHPKKAGKGSTSPNTFYLLKDIQLMATEPIIKKFRAMKIYKRHLKKAMEKKQKFEVARLKRKKPTYHLSHIVKERYPTFADALRDLDDCLCMLFLFATFPKSVVEDTLIHQARRLTIEFMNYIIASKSLRKVFISIKGYYFQAEIQGERVTWLVPHKFPFEKPSDVDFRIMATFVEFYNVMLGFVNFKLYNSLNLMYPPKLVNQHSEDSNYDEEQLAALTVDLKASVSAEPMDETDAQTASESGTLKLLPQMLLGSEDKEETARLENELQSIDELSRLFVGKKFFLGREVPRESIVFVIRSFGGQVSWDSTDGKAGATFLESDTSINYQVVDRPTYDKKYALSRAYIQPQWIFDCVNARKLLPVDEYLPGATLPPHLSPFSMPSHSLPADVESEKVVPEAPEEVPPTLKKRNKKKPSVDNKTTSNEEADEVPMKVKESREDHGAKGVKGVDADAARRRTETAERKLRELLLPKKHKRLYHKFSAKLKYDAKDQRKLEEKRRAIAAGEMTVGVDVLQKKKK